MPMIDVYAPADLFPADANRQLAQELTSALLRAEGVVTPSVAHLANTAAYIHRLDPTTVHTAGTDSRPYCAGSSPDSTWRVDSGRPEEPGWRGYRDRRKDCG